MTAHLIDRPLRLAECPRCNTLILVGMDSGVRVAVDPVRVARASLAEHLMAGKGVYLPKGQQAVRATPATLQSHQGDFLVDHGCGTAHLSAQLFEGVEPTPPPAPADGPTPVGGQSRGTEAAKNATPHLSEPTTRCNICDTVLKPGDDRILVEMPEWQTNTLHVHARGKGKARTPAYDREVSGWGMRRWSICGSHMAGIHASTGGRT